MKIKELPYSRQMFIKLLHVYFAKQSIIVLEEPYFYLDDALISCHKIYGLDEDGLKQLDIADSEDQKEVAEEQLNLNIEKISTKKNEKVILFNPSEIDCIESIEGPF